ncbi:MAG: phosphomannomutase/phosphoglucomutase [Pseudomonadales bacterium]
MGIFKKRARAEEQEEVVADFTEQWRARPNYIPPFVILMMGLACISFFEFLVLPQQEAKNAQQQSQRLAEQQVALISLTIEQLHARLEAYARSPAVQQAVVQPEAQTLQSLNVDLTEKFPEAEEVQVIPLDQLGITGLRRFNIKLRNNIEADLITKLEDGEPVELEAYKFDDGYHLSLLEDIPGAKQDTVRGAILLRLPVDFLQTVLGNLSADSGRTQLVQTFQSRELLLAQSGRPYKDSAPVVDARLEDSNWLVRFAPGKEVISSAAIPRMPVWMTLAVPFLIGTLWLLYNLRKAANKSVDQLRRLTEYVQSLVDGNRPKPPEFDDDRVNHLTVMVGQIKPPASRKVLHSDADEKDSGNDDAKQDALDIADAEVELSDVNMPEAIFRAYDIRGIAERDLGNDVVYAIGMAIGSEAAARGHQSIVIAADGRHSSPRIKERLTQALMRSGQNVIDIGQAPTPLMYFATHHLETHAGVIVTGSHNAADYNGFKLVLEGRPLSSEHIQRIRERTAHNDYQRGEGSYREGTVTAPYVEIIRDDIAVAQSLKVVVDAGNGVAGEIAPLLLEALGCEVVPLFCDVDGNFPNHEPDPSRAENMQDLASAVTNYNADLGVAFDGDGDRIGVVTSDGTFVEPDRLLMLFAQDIVSRNPGADIIYDVKCTRHLNAVISKFGGRPIMWKSGHSLIKEKMLETGALLGGEYTGHICFKERWFGFDDGIYSAARLIEIITTSGLTLEELLEEFPSSVATPEIILETGDSQKFALVEALIDNAKFGSGKITTLDGIRVDYPDGWGLVRPSNTVPALTLRFEADSDEALERIQSVFREQLGIMNPQLASAF